MVSQEIATESLMRILVLGAGAIGGYFGGRLAECGADVSFLVRARRKAELDAGGLIVKSPAGDLALKVKTLEAHERAAPFDVVFLSCKSYDLETAIEAIAPAVGPASAILPLLNGIRHIEQLAERFGAERVMGGACYISATLEAGVVRHIGALQALAFGEIGAETSARARAIAAEFAGTKVTATLSPAIVQAMWEKWVMLAALAVTTTLARASVGEILAAPSGEAFLLAALAECAAVAGAEGHAPSPAAQNQARGLLTARGSAFAASMMRDLAAGRRTEGEHIIGDLVARAHRHGLEVPILKVALAALEVHELRVQKG
jgi:2-dehydropantoate 2-reductase